MKKISILAVLLVITLAANAQQSHKDTIRNNYTREFMLNPLPFFVGGFEIGYGIVQEKSNTRVFAGYYFSEEPGSYSSSYTNMEGFRAEIQHLFIKPIDGGMRYYAGGFGTFKTIKMDKNESLPSRTSTVNGTAISFGVLIGFRSFVADNFFFDLYLGGGPTIPLNSTFEDEVHIPVVNPYKRSINPKAGLTFGIAF